MVAIVRPSWTARQYEPYARHKGRVAGKTAGTWLDDLASLRKAVCLCDACQPRFNASSYGYRRIQAVPGYNHVKGQCDGCRDTTDCNVFLPLEQST